MPKKRTARERKRKKMFGLIRPRGAPQNPLNRIFRQVGPLTPTPGTWRPSEPMTRQAPPLRGPTSAAR